jgi:DNA-directed RNA polymerase sigma subunit (sigma70/sigma32)
MSSQTWDYFIAFIQNARELNRKEKEILVKRLQAKKLEKIGRKYKLTGERIRQIEKEALAKFGKKITQLLLLD